MSDAETAYMERRNGEYEDSDCWRLSDGSCGEHRCRTFCDGCDQCMPDSGLHTVYAEDYKHWIVETRECWDCISAAGDDYQQCNDCRVYFHVDMDAIHAPGICDDCAQRRLDAESCNPELEGVA